VSAQEAFDAYLLERGRAAREHGLRAGQIGDPDAFDEAIAAIRVFAGWPGAFDASNVRSRLTCPGPEVGAAFSALAKTGEIRPCGYIDVERPRQTRRVASAMGRDSP
jgi:hypothetical protein